MLRAMMGRGSAWIYKAASNVKANKLNKAYCTLRRSLSHIKLHLAFSLIIPLSATSSADEIILVNGDILQGTQTEITDTQCSPCATCG